MDKGSYLVFAQEFAQGSKKLSVSRTESTEPERGPPAVRLAVRNRGWRNVLHSYVC